MRPRRGRDGRSHRRVHRPSARAHTVQQHRGLPSIRVVRASPAVPRPPCSTAVAAGQATGAGCAPWVAMKGEPAGRGGSHTVTTGRSKLRSEAAGSAPPQCQNLSEEQTNPLEGSRRFYLYAAERSRMFWNVLIAPLLTATTRNAPCNADDAPSTPSAPRCLAGVRPPASAAAAGKGPGDNVARSDEQRRRKQHRHHHRHRHD